MNNFVAALAAIERLKKERVVKDYAIGGAIALVFWSEPIPTFDLDVFVLLPSKKHSRFTRSDIRVGPSQRVP